MEIAVQQQERPRWLVFIPVNAEALIASSANSLLPG